MTAERNIEIVRLRHVERLTLGQIGDRFGLSYERVRQILIKQTGSADYPGPPLSHYKRIAEAVAFVARREHTRRHGTARRYALGCKCRECRKANADRHLRYQRRTTTQTPRKRYRWPELDEAIQ